MIEISEYDRAELGWNVVLDGGGDPDDHCLHCDKLIGYPPDMEAHDEDCPYKTGVWTIERAVHEFKCDGCGEEHVVQYTCARCQFYFEDGDAYRVIDDGTGLVVPWVEAPGEGTAICIDCAQRQADALMERMG